MEFIADDAFPIEESTSIQLMPRGSKIIDLVRKTGSNLLLIEAKSSFPNCNNHESTSAFDEQIEDIVKKFIDSLTLYSAIKVGVTNDVLPDSLENSDKIKLVLVLVIRGFEREQWCRPVQKAIMMKLPESMKKLWNPSVQVYNYTLAKEYRLVE
jgi:hypothetical protein